MQSFFRVFRCGVISCLLSVSFVYSHTAEAQNFFPPVSSGGSAQMPSLIPDSTVAAISNLTVAIGELVEAISSFQGQVGEYAPDLTAIAKSLSISFESLSREAPSAADSAADIALALTRLADFSDSLNENRVEIACAAVGVIGGGIVLGHALNEYIFTMNVNKNIVWRIINQGSLLVNRCMRKPRPSNQKAGSFDENTQRQDESFERGAVNSEV